MTDEDNLKREPSPKPVALGADNTITTDSKARKEIPFTTGLIDYFPRACAAIAHLSFVGNQKHNPGQPLHWSRDKSNDHADCIGRHLVDRGKIDAEGNRHSVQLAWRALANAELELEAAEKAKA